MNREERLDLLNRVLHGTVNSVIQYIDVAAPYVPAGLEDCLGELRRMRDEEVTSANEISDLVTELDGVSKVGVFDYWNVDLNYLDVRFLAGFAVEHVDKVVAEIESGIAAASDDARIVGLLTRVLARKKAHREALVAIAEKPGPKEDPEAKAAAQPKEAQHVPRPVRD